MPPLDKLTGLAKARIFQEDEITQPPDPPQNEPRRNSADGLFDFANTEKIKQKVRQAKGEEAKAYNVHDMYYETGFFQRIAKDHYFENFTLGVIVINAIWISIDTDYNKGDTLLDAHVIFQIVDSCFFIYFLAEVFIRFMAFRRKVSCLFDAWFVFDSILVTLYAFDPFGIAIIVAASNGGKISLPTSILRLFRLARLSRLVRMLRSLPELMMMIKGIVTATASVSYTLGLLMVITYVFGIALTQLSADKEYGEEFFRSVPLSMYSLIIYGTFLDDLAHFADRIKEESTFCLVLVTLFVVLASMTVMNMLVGVLCEVISATAETEKESMMTDTVYERFGAIVQELDTNNNNKLSWVEFQQIMQDDHALSALESVDVDPFLMIDFAEEFFFDDYGNPVELSFDNFMTMILDMRGGQEATLKDVMQLSKDWNRKMSDVKQRCFAIGDMLDEYAQKTGRGHLVKMNSRQSVNVKLLERAAKGSAAPSPESSLKIND